MCSFSIDILNFSDQDIITYSLILIKGVINSDSSSLTEPAFVECICRESSNNWPVVNFNFRCLVLLEDGTNEILFKYKEVYKKFVLEFRKKSSEFCVFPLLITFSDTNGNECVDNSYYTILRRISFCAKLLQCFYAEKLYESGFGHKTFALIEDILDNHSGCYLFQSKLPLEKAKMLSPELLWETVGREIMKSSIGNSKCKYLGVTALSSYDEHVSKIFEIALGSGGLALIDSHPVFTWPSSVDQVLTCFNDSTPLQQPLSYNIWYRGTYGGCCSASIGSLCHELGHTFDLGHPISGIMSTDFHLFHNAFLPSPNKNCVDTSFDLHFIPDITPLANDSSIRKNVSKKPSAISKGKCVDKSSFTPGCVAILAYHKWFNNHSLYYNIKFDHSRLVLESKGGLKVVQIRGDNGKVIKSWEFSGEKTEYMVLPRFPSCMTVFAMDKYGNISKFLCNFEVNN